MCNICGFEHDTCVYIENFVDLLNYYNYGAVLRAQTGSIRLGSFILLCLYYYSILSESKPKKSETWKLRKQPLNYTIRLCTKTRTKTLKLFREQTDVRTVAKIRNKNKGT